MQFRKAGRYLNFQRDDGTILEEQRLL